MRAPRRPFHLFGVAVQLLTRLPVPVDDVTDEDLRRASALFPSVGVLVAAVVVAVRWAMASLVGRPAATVVALAAGTIVTGAFHEDGLADTVDGLWGGWSPERRVEIMRDSRVGTYGAMALVGFFVLRVALLAPLPLVAFARAVVAGHVLGRAAGVALAAAGRPVSDQGLGAKVIGPSSPRGAAVAAFTAAVAAAWATGVWSWLPLATTVVAVIGVRAVADRKLGGLTGDLLGAVNEVAHVLALMVVVGLWRRALV